MREVQQAVDNFNHHQLTSLLNGEAVTVEVGSEKIVITPEDVAVERQVREGLVAANLNTITIALPPILSHWSQVTFLIFSRHRALESQLKVGFALTAPEYS